ncbi:hypothetical protein ACFSTA_02985 [Ornithinibacillus salinisoli]|uniref:DUF5668 domain-containing protein n=1 Tax=Ornithinibacillus salinisoli TaxID=1848459 RepID=A0ABW4VXT6_9BACI
MKKYDVGFVVAGSLMTIVFLITINFITSSKYIWSVYPSIALLLFPIGFYLMKKKEYTLFSILSSLGISIYLIVENFMSTPGYPWFLYAVAPLAIYPILVILGKRAQTMPVAIIGSGSIIIYYLVLNLFLSPQYPWVIFPAFAVLWWPLTIYHVKRKAYVRFSIYASIFISVFFISVNAISSPHEIWAIYPIFVVLWWPLSMYFFVHKRQLELYSETAQKNISHKSYELKNYS